MPFQSHGRTLQSHDTPPRAQMWTDPGMRGDCGNSQHHDILPARRNETLVAVWGQLQPHRDACQQHRACALTFQRNPLETARGKLY